MAWLVTLWLIHRYLFALPLPEAPKWVWALSPSLGLSSKNIPYVESAFPTPPKRMGDNIDSVDPLYRAYEPLPEPEAPFPQLRPTRFLPKECLESWFIYGELACTAEELGDEDTLDATWLWVNGTDKRWAEDERYWTSELGVNSPPKHFR